MVYLVLADAAVVLHLAFVLFVVLGGLLALRRPRAAWVHLPTAAWGAAVEFGGWICPLTPLENWLREQGGRVGYSSGFVEHYLVPVLYPAALTREIQFALGALVLVVNAAVYGTVLWRRFRAGRGRVIRAAAQAFEPRIGGSGKGSPRVCPKK